MDKHLPTPTPIIALCLTPSEQTLIASCRDGYLLQWRLPSAEPLSERQMAYSVYPLAPSPDGTRLAGLLADGSEWDTLVICTLATGEPLHTVPLGTSPAFEEWNARADSADGYLHLNVSPYTLVWRGDEQLTIAHRLQYGPDGGPAPHYGSSGLRLQTWSLQPAPRLVEDRVLDRYVYHDASTVFSPDGNWFATGNENGCTLYSLNGEQVASLNQCGKPVTFSPDGTRLVTIRSDRFALWQVPSLDLIGGWRVTVDNLEPIALAELRRAYPPPEPITGLTVAVTDADLHNVVVAYTRWISVKEMPLLTRLRNEWRNVLGIYQGEIGWFSLPSGQRLLAQPSESYRSIQLTADGRWLLFGGQQGAELIANPTPDPQPESR
jgi:WD40 repeat protein